MKRVECQVCGKDCVEFYCFRTATPVYRNRYGGVYWKGKRGYKSTNRGLAKSGGLGGSNPPMCKQSSFDFGDGSTEPY